MWPRCVVVLHVFTQYAPQMCFIDDQQPIQAFLPCGPNPSFCERIRLGCPVWRPYDFDAFSSEDSVETRGKLGVTITNQEAFGQCLIMKGPGELSRLLG